MPITPTQAATLNTWLAENRAKYPPPLMAGIGQPPLAMVPAAFGGLLYSGSVSVGVTANTPVKIAVFDQIYPPIAAVNPEAVYADIANSLLSPQYDGIYLVQGKIAGNFPTGSTLRLGLFINGVVKGGSFVDLSNQSSGVVLEFFEPHAIPAGSTLELYATSSLSGTATVTTAGLFMTRIR